VTKEKTGRPFRFVLNVLMISVPSMPPYMVFPKAVLYFSPYLLPFRKPYLYADDIQLSSLHLPYDSSITQQNAACATDLFLDECKRKLLNFCYLRSNLQIACCTGRTVFLHNDTISAVLEDDWWLRFSFYGRTA